MSSASPRTAAIRIAAVLLAFACTAFVFRPASPAAQPGEHLPVVLASLHKMPARTLESQMRRFEKLRRLERQSEAGAAEPAGSSRADALGVNALAPAPLTATLTDNLAGVAVLPGDTISYTAVLTNQDVAEVTGIAFSATLDVNTALVPGSVRVSPLVIPDAHSGIEGVERSEASATGLLSNDFMGLPSAALTSFSADGWATAHAAGATASVGTDGSLAINADGSFSFTPATGSAGAFEVAYTLLNAAGADTNTATFTVSAPVIAAPVDDEPAEASAPGDAYHGALDSEFTLSAPGVLGNDARGTPEAALAAFSTDDWATSHTAGDLAPVGVDGSLTVNADGSVSFEPPTGFTGLFSFQYRLSNVAGDAEATVQIGVGVRPAPGDDTYATSLVGNVPVNTANSTGFSVRGNDAGDELVLALRDAVNGSAALDESGTFTFTPDAGYEGAASFAYSATNGFGTEEATVNLTVDGVVWFVDNTAGAGGTGRLGEPFNSLASFGSDAADESDDVIFLYSGSGAYSGGITLLSGQKLIGQGASGTFASASGLTFPADAATLPPVGGTKPEITTNTASTAGVTLGTDNALRGLRIGNTTGAGIFGSSFGILTVSGVDVAGTGAALDLTSGTLDASGGFGLLSSISSAGFGISLNDVAGTLSNTDASSALSGAALAELRVNVGAVDVTYNGAITNTAGRSVEVLSRSSGTVTLPGAINDTGAGMLVQNVTGGSVNLTGFSKTFSTGANKAVTLASNTGATVQFTGGGLLVTTSTGNGFEATGGGTVHVTGPNNTITSTGGIALNVVNTTIGASGLTFRSISANGGANGIVLSNTGSGGLSVTGDGITPGSGGTIANTSGADGATAGNAVFLQEVQNVTLSRLQINDHSNHGIRGMGVTNFALQNSVVNGTNGNSLSGAFNEGAVHFDDLSGVVTIRDNTISGGALDNIYVSNVSGSPVLNPLQLLNNTIGGPINQDGVRISATAGIINVRATGNNFTYWEGDAFDFLAQGSSTGQLLFQNNTAHNTNVTPVSGSTNIAVGGGNFTYNISNNSFRGALGAAVAVDESGSLVGSVSGTIDNNQIGASGVANSGSAQGNAIFVSQLGAGTSTTKISNNVIRQINGSPAINVQIGDATGGGGNGTLNATITGNNIQEAGTTPNSGRLAIYANIGTSSPDAPLACLDIGGSGANENFITNFGLNRIRPSARFNSTVRMPGYTGPATGDAASVASYLQPRNDASGMSPTINVQNTSTVGFTNTPGGAACPQPATVSIASGEFQGGSFGDDFLLASEVGEAADAVTVEQAVEASVADVTDEDAFTSEVQSGLASEAGEPGYSAMLDTTRYIGGPLLASSDRLTGILASLTPPEGEKPESAVIRLLPEAKAEVVCDACADVYENIGTIPAGRSVTITFQATVNDPISVTSVSTQGIVDRSMGQTLTDDPDTPDALDATVTAATPMLTLTLEGQAGEGNDVGWRMLSAPGPNVTRADLEDDFVFSTSNGSMFQIWDGAGWQPSTDPSDTLSLGRGFILYVFDDEVDPLGATRALDVPGPVPASDVTVSGMDIASQWELMGNPYDTGYDLTGLGLAGAGFQATAQVWDPASGSYQLFTESADSTDVLAAWQGFFVERSEPGAGADALTFAAVGKTTGGTLLGKQAAPAMEPEDARIALRLVSRDASGAEATRDEATGLLFVEGAAAGWDAWDATKLSPLGSRYAVLSLAGTRGGAPVLKAQDARPVNGEAAWSYDVVLSAKDAGASYVISWPEWERVPEAWKVHLVDLQTGTRVDMRRDSQYVFAEAKPQSMLRAALSAGDSVGADVVGETGRVATLPAGSGVLGKSGGAVAPLALSGGSLHFRIEVDAATGTGVEDGAVPEGVHLEAVYPNPAAVRAHVRYTVSKQGKVRISLYDMLGRRVGVVEDGERAAGRHTAIVDATGLAAGQYVVRLEADGKIVHKALTLLN